MERHRRIQQTGALVALLCFPCAAFAQDPLPLRLIPEYTSCDVKNVRYACYTDQQMLELYTLETQARGWHKESVQYRIFADVQEGHLNTLKLTLDKYVILQKRADDHVMDLEEKLFDFIEINAELEDKINNPPTWPL